MTKEQTIRTYFQMWLNRDFSNWQQFFMPEVEYLEFYGPIYQGYPEMQAWINHQMQVQQVSDWTIKSCQTDQNPSVVAWHFEATEKQLETFDGVSLIWFHNHKISRVEEYAMTGPHSRPYKNGVCAESRLENE